MSDVVSDRMMYDHLEQVAARQDEAAYLRCQVQLLTDEVERLRLTDKELKAIRRAAAVADEMHDSRLKAALGGLLERIG
jgi:Xaa-Pro aminopeptidase